MTKKTLSSIVLRSWYVVAFILFGLIIYENTLSNREQLHSQLRQQWEMLKKEKELKLSLQQELKDHISSYQDPQWIELILMKNLGLTPKGKQKILFIDQ